MLTDFGTVEALAADESILYVVSRGGIGIYDRRFRRWDPPITPLDGYMVQRVHAALVDPSDRSLWLATDQGLLSYDPHMRRFETVSVPGGASQLMFDRSDAFAGIYFRGSSGWQFLPRGGVVPQRAGSIPSPRRQLRTASVQEVLERHPYVATMRAVTLSDERLRRYRYTAGAEVPLTDEVFLGTDGLGVIRFDAATTDLEPLPFGLLGPGAAAVEAVPGGVWVGTDERSPRSGFTFVSDDLQRFEFEQGPRVTGLGMGLVRDILARGRELWAATDAGVLRVGPGGATRRITSADGLPTTRVLALAQGHSGVWVGTGRGLGFVGDDETVARVGVRLVDPVTALAVARDTAWVGTSRGLGLSWPGADRVVVPPDVAQTPELRDGVVALALSADTLVVATRERIIWRPLASGQSTAESRRPPARGQEPESPRRWVVERVISTELGELTALAGDAAGVWIGGIRGISLYRFSTRDFLFFNTPGDLPGAVRDLAVTTRYLWVATEGGLVRFARSSLLP